MRGMSHAMHSTPLTVKLRMGKRRGRLSAHNFLPRLREWGACAVTLHGRTKEQRYSQTADCAPGVSNLCGPFWLRFTYVAPVLVTKY